MNVLVSSGKVRFEKDTSTFTDRELEQDDVGHWQIYIESDTAGTDHSYRMSRCGQMAMELALADALREVKPDHPLLAQYWLQPENRDKLSKY
jgi:hypothetical protein